jgi:hypothetical protein
MIDITTMRKKMEKCKDAGSVLHHRGKQVGSYNPAALPLEKRALIEAEDILQKAGCGAMFSVYSQLSERYKSLIVLLPVSQTIPTSDTVIARFLRELELIKLVVVDDSKTKMYCLSWYYGIPAKKAKLDVAEMFNADAERTIRDVREMLVYALHLVQQAQQAMRAEQSSERFREIIAGWEKLKQSLSQPDMANEDIEAIKRAIPHGGADLLVVEPERIYNFITSTYAKQIADNNNAYNEYQRWKRELLLTMNNDDSADGGGNAISMGR